jgi:hypothetical protein
MAHLKVRPFKTACHRVFPQLVKPCPFKSNEREVFFSSL